MRFRAGLKNTVTWRAISADSHRVHGSLVFYVGAPGGNTAGAAAAVQGRGAPGEIGVLRDVVRGFGFDLLLLVATPPARASASTTGPYAVTPGIGPFTWAGRVAGPGHFVFPGATLPLAGRWSLRIEVRRGEFEELTSLVTVATLAKPVVLDGETVKSRIATVTWTAAGSPMAPGEFAVFSILIAVPDQAGAKLVFPTVQTYANGKVVRWIGRADAELPAPVLAVGAAPKGGA